MDETTLPFGLWLKHQRRAMDLTQEVLAQQIGCALVTLRKIESGERRPSKQILERLAAILSIPPAEQPAFMAYARAVYPDAAPPLPRVAPEAPEQVPWRTPGRDLFSNNLPAQLTSFIGRQREMAEVRRLLGETRLMTLTGAGGAGKTRLALEAAAGLRPDFTDGIWWVELASLYDPALVPQAVGAALGLRDQASRPMLDQLGDHLRARRLLLVLDNCEHLIAACAITANTLLRVAPTLRILVTSREPLEIAGEITYRVPSLETPDPAHLPPFASLARFEAVRLFADRAAAVLPGFVLTEANGSAVAEICCGLDGIPLAIELAAARMRTLSVEELRVRLRDRFRVLTGGSRVALPRHRTLRATIDWSYGLLSEPERVLLRRLAVFTGGWTLEAAEAVCSGDGVPEGEVLDLLAHLVDKSLVILEWPSDVGRYRLLETVRQYGLELLEERGETLIWRQRHASFFLAVAEEAEPKLFGPEQDAWFARLEAEHGNLRAALEWLAQQDEALQGLRLAGALWRFWEVRGHLAEARTWLSEMLRRAGPNADAAARAKALMGAGGSAYYLPRPPGGGRSVGGEPEPLSRARRPARDGPGVDLPGVAGQRSRSIRGGTQALRGGSGDLSGDRGPAGDRLGACTAGARILLGRGSRRRPALVGAGPSAQPGDQRQAGHGPVDVFARATSVGPGRPERGDRAR